MVCWRVRATTLKWSASNVDVDAAAAPVEVVARAADADGAVIADAAARVVAVARATTIRRSLEIQPAHLNQQGVFAPGGKAHGSPTGGIRLPEIGKPVLSGIDREAPGYGARWRAAVIPLALIVLALALSLPRLTTPAVYVFDELYYAYTAGKYVAGDEAYSTEIPPRDDPAIEWTHPPLAKLLIAGGILIAGDNPLGWRMASVLFGVAGVVIAYLLALSLTGNRVTSGVAAGLLLMDGLYLVESRTGMSNLFVLVFANGVLLAFSRVLTVPPERVGPPLLATGLFIGLGVATKWSGIALAGLVVLVVCWRTLQLWHFSRPKNQSAAAGPSPLGADRTGGTPGRHLYGVVPALLAYRARLGRFHCLAPGHARLPPQSGYRPRRFFTMVAMAAGGSRSLVLR